MNKSSQEESPASVEVLDLRAALAVVRDAERSARRQLNGNTAFVYVLWGLTWALGYGALLASQQEWLPLAPEAALIILAVSLGAATVSTVIVFARGARGVRGQSALQGGLYGTAWCLGFVVMGALGGVLTDAIEDFWLRGLLINSISVLIVGLLYITGGTTFNDPSQSYLGIWLLLVTVIGLLTGPERFLFVFLFLGATGLLAGGALEYLRTRRRSGTAHA